MELAVDANVVISAIISSAGETRNLIPDPNDTEYLALSLSRNIPLWSDDKALKKQSLVKVYSTTELLEEFRQ